MPRRRHAPLDWSSGESDCPDELDRQLRLLAKRRKVEPETSAQQSQPDGWSQGRPSGATSSASNRAARGQGSAKSGRSRLSKKADRQDRSSNAGAEDESSASSEEGDVDRDGSAEEDSDGGLVGDQGYRARRAVVTEECREQEKLVAHAGKRGRPKKRFGSKNRPRLAKRYEQTWESEDGDSSASSQGVEAPSTSSGCKGRHGLAKRYEQTWESEDGDSSASSQGEQGPSASSGCKRRRTFGRRKGKKARTTRGLKAARQKQLHKGGDKRQKSLAEGEVRLKTSKRLQVSDVYSDDDGEDESDGGAVGGTTSERGQSTSSFQPRAQSGPEPPAAAAKEDIGRMRLTRNQLKVLIHVPTFASIAVGCFVRVRTKRRTVYRLMEVTAVVETANVRSLGLARTNKALRLRHGSREKVRRLGCVSNQQFTDREFQKWKRLTISKGAAFPTPREVAQKASDIQAALRDAPVPSDGETDGNEEERGPLSVHNYAAQRPESGDEKGGRARRKP
ncbi:hypothetical protein V5799_009905 [Amblyomma americanum]|uniref:Plus3 domain-containing protein n=1 Tax=Amblyomma americanum TaxID=6943 RepID=A0AAQ4F923_AMBAM